MLVGYARISTSDQRLDLQKDALEKAGCEQVFEDVVSGSDDKKQELEKALSFLRPGDTLVVWRLDRLGRSLKALVALMGELGDKGIEFKSLVEAIDTTTATGQFFFHITAAFAELERNLIRERTKAGLASARARGRCGGRPRALNKKTFEMALKLYESNQGTVAEICEGLDIKTRTFYRYLKSHREASSPSLSAQNL